MTKYNHQNYFVHLYRVFESKTSYYLILNLMKGKSLTAYYNKIKVSDYVNLFEIRNNQIPSYSLQILLNQL